VPGLVLVPHRARRAAAPACCWYGTAPGAPRRGKALPADGGIHRHPVPQTARYRRLKQYRRRHSPTGNAPKIRANKSSILFSIKSKKRTPQTRSLWPAVSPPPVGMWKTFQGRLLRANPTSSRISYFLRAITPRVTLSEAGLNAFVSRMRNFFGSLPRHSYRIGGEHTWARMRRLRQE
jgi:hypothetical protein